MGGHGGEARARWRQDASKHEGEGAEEPGDLGGLPADSSPAGTDFTNRQDLGVLGMAVGSTCLPTHGWRLISGER